jgi:hypothetical protein
MRMSLSLLWLNLRVKTSLLSAFHTVASAISLGCDRIPGFMRELARIGRHVRIGLILTTSSGIQC